MRGDQWGKTIFLAIPVSNATSAKASAGFLRLDERRQSITVASERLVNIIPVRPVVSIGVRRIMGAKEKNDGVTIHSGSAPPMSLGHWMAGSLAVVSFAVILTAINGKLGGARVVLSIRILCIAIPTLLFGAIGTK